MSEPDIVRPREALAAATEATADSYIDDVDVGLHSSLINDIDDVDFKDQLAIVSLLPQQSEAGVGYSQLVAK